MIKRVELDGGHSIELSGSVGWLIVYRSNFGRDILPDIMPLLESFLSMSIEVLQKSKKKKNNEIDVRELITALDGDMLTDIFINLSGMETITLLQIVWAMAKKANRDIPNFDDFFDEFETFPLDVVIPEAIKLIIESSVSSKNAKSLLTTLSGLKPVTKE